MEQIDFAVFPMLQGGPHNHQIAALATQLKEVHPSSTYSLTHSPTCLLARVYVHTNTLPPLAPPPHTHTHTHHHGCIHTVTLHPRHLQVNSPAFKEYIKQVVKNAQALSSALQSTGNKIATDGTDTHLMLWDLRPHDVTGSKMEVSMHQSCPCHGACRSSR
jgi:glycine/serine hydroxymethyltransferase